MLFPSICVAVAPYLEVNWKLFTLRFLRLPAFQEVVLTSGPFDHPFYIINLHLQSINIQPIILNAPFCMLLIIFINLILQLS